MSLFADAKRLTYIGDRAAASELVREFMEPWQVLPSEKRQLLPHETPFGKFLGSQWQAQMPDGSFLRMYRGLNSEVYEQILQRSRDKKTSIRHRGKFRSESEGNGKRAIVRSIAPDGSLLEIEIG